MVHKINAYLASPLFNAREREFNQLLADRLEFQVNIFVPQRDGASGPDLPGRRTGDFVRAIPALRHRSGDRQKESVAFGSSGRSFCFCLLK